VAVADAMASDTTGYARATTVRDFAFPADHGPHPGFKTEWWYFTGNLEAEGGRHVGYQFTLFRIALAPPNDGDDAPVRPASLAEDDAEASPWRTDQFYMGHLAVSDVQNARHPEFERFSRGAAGLAGARVEPRFRVWLEDWEAVALDSTGGAFPMRLRALEGGTGVDLTFRPEKPPVFQGEDGLSQKGPEPGNASFYYSYTRLATEGRVALGGDTLAVTGLSWMDREWSTSALGDEQEGWDWFAWQLSDGRDLMYYQLRQNDGTPSRFSKGIVVEPDGASTVIRREDVELEVLERWTSPEGVTYPTRWRLAVPSQRLDLTGAAYFPNQVMDLSVRYWEGAVRLEGTSRGTDVTGSGYVEMTGYGDTDAARTGS
jgi:predicted secreted hydrolase